MTAHLQAIRLDSPNTQIADSNWNSLYKLGGAAALGIVLTALIEMLITFLPGGYTASETVLDWFRLLHENPFLGLRNLGLLNIVMTICGIPLYLALYSAHRKVIPAFAALATILAFIGATVSFSTNRALPMLELSVRYAAATSQPQRAMIAAAGQALLSVGQSHTPGTFLAFFLSETAGILISLVMLKAKVFNRATALVGMFGFGALFIFEILSSFAPSSQGAILILAMGGGLLSTAWYILIARRLSELGRGAA